MREEFSGTLTGYIDSDSVLVMTDDKVEKRVRIGGIDSPSYGPQADRAKSHIMTWKGRRVHFHETCCNRPHGEIPGVLVDDHGNNLGKELVHAGFARRWAGFPIKSAAQLPALFLK